MDPIVIEMELGVRDWEALQAYAQRRVTESPMSVRSRAVAGLTVAGSVILSYFATRFLDYGFQPFSLLAGVIITVICGVVLGRQNLKRYRPLPDSPFLAPSRMELSNSGIRVTREGQTSFTEWSAIERIDVTGDHVFLAMDRMQAYTVPKRVITSLPVDEFLNRTRHWHSARGAILAGGANDATFPASVTEAQKSFTASAQLASGTAPGVPFGPDAASEAAGATADAPLAAASKVGADHGRGGSLGAPLASSSTAATPSAPRTFWNSLKANLTTGVRLLLFRRVEPGDFVSTFDQVAALLAITLAVATGLDWLRADDGAQFFRYGLTAWSVWLLFAVGLCALTARASSPRGDTRTFLVAAFSVAPWVIALLWMFDRVPLLRDSDTIPTLLTIVVVLPVALRVVRAVHGFMRPAAFIVVVLATLLMGSLNGMLYLDLPLWQSIPDEAERDSYANRWAEAEPLFFAQPSMISAAVDELEAERPGVSDIFYVGFAGDGSQRVFRREALFAGRVFGERMGSGKRSLELVNDYQDHIAYPLASISALRYSLGLVAERMNLEEDMLVLFLTSHGSKEGGIHVNNTVLPAVTSDLSPREVRVALDGAAIKWRVVVVSACYAGVFLEPLKSENTVVITAADADHNSFGCADKRDLTYFGEAFLRDALPRAPSLEAAFRQAREAIAQREKAENKTPSNPQMFVGEAVARKLAQLGTFPIRAFPTNANPTSSNK
jgi:hypothetical protein